MPAAERTRPGGNGLRHSYFKRIARLWATGTQAHAAGPKFRLRRVVVLVKWPAEEETHKLGPGRDRPEERGGQRGAPP